MPSSNNPTLVVAGTHSGSGKTTITLGLLKALQERGHMVQPFKCGPDFIDPSLHKMVTGRISRNLDPWMCGDEYVRSAFARHSRQANISVVEGVKGMFDGGVSSSASLAKVLEAPLILVLDVRSAAESVAAVLKGFETLDPEVAPKGVILNRVASDRHLSLISAAIKKHCQAEILGFLPRELDFAIPSRHLGLQMGEEEPLNQKGMAQLSRTIAEHVNLDRLVAIAEECRDTEQSSFPADEVATAKVRIGIARDKAFCFYYEDNLDLLRQAGAELEFFSPLEESALPQGVDGLYFGGGFPELYAGKLAENKNMLVSIRDLAEKGLPIYAECGGFMYLTEGIYNEQGQLYTMAGVFPVRSRMGRKRSSLGYREVTLQDDFFFGSAGTILRGHEFHYSVIDDMPHQIDRIYALNNNTQEGYRYKNVLGSYMHLHFGYTPDAAAKFVNMCKG
jgi:cobyrinic acid a,c-diamide synthase